MPQKIDILEVKPTQLLKKAGDILHQIAHVRIVSDRASQSVQIHAITFNRAAVTVFDLAAGESVYTIEIPEIAAPENITVALVADGSEVVRKLFAWVPPKRWTVHVVQTSHHDVGYTDLPSHVLSEHDRMIDSILDMSEAAAAYPEDARFRAVIEQSWSLDHYLKTAPPERAEALIRLLQVDDLEMTALFGNMVTELCGHETLARSVYHAFRIKREHGIPVISAEHNDIPGFSWGLAQVLVESGVEFFCPGLPLYYSWGQTDATSFWDEKAIFGAEHIPGAFWWESPSGKKVLFWCNNQGCGGDWHPDMPGFADKLQELSESIYPYTVLRWPVIGGARDNSPYIDGYTKTICEWNERWEYPHLVSSTNARFYRDLLPQLPSSLKVIRGDVPGQDYPSGAASTAQATAINRRNHSYLPNAEALAAVANAVSDYRYQDARIFNAYEESLWHDEHTWGHHFPSSGASATTSELEKAVHAHRGAALAHDVANKAMARIADAVQLDDDGLYLVVFNTAPQTRSGIVTTPMREMDNCGSEMIKEEDGSLRGVLLQDRWHLNPPIEYAEGLFDLVDMETGKIVDYQIDQIQSAYDTVPYAAQRIGIGSGGKRYGFFEDPAGLMRDLKFYAENIPALGYKTYKLQPRKDRPVFVKSIKVSESTLENQYYRLELDPATGSVRSILDKETSKELVKANPRCPFGKLLIRDPFGNETLSEVVYVRAGSSGPVEASLYVRSSAVGHPIIEQKYTLYANEKRIGVSVNIIKDPTPLLEVFLAFPFNIPGGDFRYQGPLCVTNPARDLMPGAYADRLTVQDYVSVSDNNLSVVWNSKDAPVVSLGDLWPGRVSPAHSAKMRADVEHPQPAPEELRGGTIYSLLTANNFGTNFAVSQSGSILFEYSFTTQTGAVSDSSASGIGYRFTSDLTTIFTTNFHPGTLPMSGGFMTIDNPDIRMTAFKRAEDGSGYILRIWNCSNKQAAANIIFNRLIIKEAELCNIGEEPLGTKIVCKDNTVPVNIDSQGIITLYLYAEC